VFILSSCEMLLFVSQLEKKRQKRGFIRRLCGRGGNE